MLQNGMLAKRTWWKDGTAYQIYPASFKDSNGDGLGDIPGIISKIDYLKDLGIDIVWISPMYKSPQVDMGYDISDYEDVHGPYGTVQDMEILINACHDRGMKILLDLVINHTSNEHPWFQESRSSKTNPKRDWYIWRPPQYSSSGKRMPPNNWRSNFSGPAWTYDELTDEYYLHLFAPEQPDLNFENKETRQAIYDSALTFWLQKGVDGFRIDTVNMYSKGDLEDVPIVDSTVFDQLAEHVFCNGPRMHEFLREMNDQILQHYDTMTVGELPCTPDPAHVLRYVGANDKQLSMVFQFDIVDLDKGKAEAFGLARYNLMDLKDVVAKWQQFIAGTDGWTTAFLENHDQGRSISRFASDAPEHRVNSGKMLATFLTTLTGTLFIYQGQEIGMINCPEDWGVEEFKDVAATQPWEGLKRRNLPPRELEVARKRLMKGMQRLGRHNSRTPMQWDGTANSGFTSAGVEPWMRVHDNYPEINVKSQQGDKGSILNFWKKMINLRKEYQDVFIHGSFKVLDRDNEDTFVYEKEFQGKKALVALNFTGEEQSFAKPAGEEELKLLVGSYDDPKEKALGPYEARVYIS